MRYLRGAWSFLCAVALLIGLCALLFWMALEDFEDGWRVNLTSGWKG